MPKAAARNRIAARRDPLPSIDSVAGMMNAAPMPAMAREKMICTGLSGRLSTVADFDYRSRAEASVDGFLATHAKKISAASNESAGA